MNCQTAQNLISAFIDCELDVDQKRELRNHIFNCRDCYYEYEQMSQFKNVMENIYQEPVAFDTLTKLYARLEVERISILSPTNRFFWNNRLLLMTACLLFFFVSTFLLFPNTSKSNFRLANQKTTNLSDSYDQNFSIDQSVNVYQASFILP